MKDLESKFKSALQDHELPYDSKAWSSFKERLDAGPSASSGKSLYKKLGFAASVIGAVGLGTYFFSSDSANTLDKKDSKTEMVESFDVEVGKAESEKVRSNEGVAENVKENGVISDDLNEPSDIKDFNVQNLENLASQDADLLNEIKQLSEDERVEKFTPEFDDDEVQSGLAEGNTLNADFIVNHSTGCQGFIFEFKPTEQIDPTCEVIWDFGDGSFSDEKTPKHKYQTSGSFVVKLTLTKKKGTEIISDQSREYVQVYANPEVSFEVEEAYSGVGVPEYTFVYRSSSAVEFSWDFGDNNFSKHKNTSHIYRKKGQYSVVLSVVNEFGCVGKAQERITIDSDYNLLAPTAFTPNGDGRNDYFIPRALEIMDTEFTMSVFHKNGQLYYETNTVSRPWDGRYMKDNKEAPFGTYVWVVKLKNSDGEIEIYRGSVTVVRNL